MRPVVRKAVIWGCIILLLGILLISLYLLKVADRLKSAPITSQCNATDTNSIRSSYVVFNYALDESHWSNLSNFMNTTCLRYQTYVLNATTDQSVLHPKG